MISEKSHCAAGPPTVQNLSCYRIRSERDGLHSGSSCEVSALPPGDFAKKILRVIGRSRGNHCTTAPFVFLDHICSVQQSCTHDDLLSGGGRWRGLLHHGIISPKAKLGRQFMTQKS